MNRFEKESRPGSRPPYYISIEESNIPGAGMGAFARCDLPANRVIGEYLGKIFESDDPRATGAYLFQVYGRGGRLLHLIDGKVKKYSSWVRFVNTPQREEDANAEFFQKSGRIFIKTIRPIPAGEEIMAYYGDDYVDTIRHYFTKKNRYIPGEEMTGVKCRMQPSRIR